MQGRLLGANPAFEAATGWDPAAVPGTSLATLLHWPAEVADALTQGKSLAAQQVHGQHRDGRLLAGRMSARAHQGLQVLSWTAMLQTADAAPTGHAEAANATRSAELLAVAQRLAGMGVWARDLRTGIGHWDPQIWRFFGLPAQPNSPDFEQAVLAVHADDRASLRAAFSASLTVPGVHTCRYRVMRSDGSTRHVRSTWEVQHDAQGQPLCVQGIAMDETDIFALARAHDQTHAQLRLLGLTPCADGLPLTELAALVHPADLTQLLERLRDDQAPMDLAARYRSAQRAPGGADGNADYRWRYLLMRRVARHDDHGRLQGHVGVALDLTDRLAQQQRALELARRLEMATSAAGVGVWSVAQDGDTSVHWDEQMHALHGLPPDAPAPGLATYLGTQVHEDDRASVADSLLALMRRDQGLLDMDFRVRWPDGQVRRLATRTSVETGPAGRHLYGVVFDVTERHATEHRLREASERSALATRGAGIGTWESAPDGELGWWDEQMFRLRGQEPWPNPVCRADMLALVHPDDRDGIVRALNQAMAAGHTTNTEFRVIWPDGSVHWLASRSTPVRDEQGRSVRRIGINWDVTEARAAGGARQEKLLAQRESQAKSRFLARMSHELRTPLNAVLGFSQLLLADGPQPDDAVWRRRVQQVQASGEHLLALINDVLELSAVESGELPLRLQPVALDALVTTTLPLVELAAREQGVTLQCQPMTGLWVQADPVRLRQALLNLLSNGIKYNRAGGQVQLSARRDGDAVRLRVADTGQGMTPAQVAHLFEPFNRLGREQEGIAGTGIGLAIVRASVQQMGGTVEVQSTPDAGSRFDLLLQACAAPAELPAAPAGFALGMPLPPARSHARQTLLYIEDNDVNLLIVRELVQRRSDLRFVAASDGASGLAAARQHQPALILLDMQLPDMDGHGVLRALRADPATAAIRVVALSANAMPEDIRRALDAGCADYWTKPLDLKAFMLALDALVGVAPA
ncbi:MAG: hybrid sensor histidine kinase/response regulator [Burkholderiales bacterium PBB5]|nr:MAG: hybrid sensor histidine kinase/response regulator [Burkholderiales bacterium PBB5]